MLLTHPFFKMILEGGGNVLLSKLPYPDCQSRDWTKCETDLSHVTHLWITKAVTAQRRVAHPSNVNNEWTNNFHLCFSLSLCVCVVCMRVFRLGLQHGHRVPVPQLARVCPGCCTSCYRLPSWTYLHARESPLPSGGVTALMLTVGLFCKTSVITLRYYHISDA